MKRHSAGSLAACPWLVPLLLLMGCATVLPRGDRHEFEHLGYLTWSATGLVATRPRPQPDPNVALLQREAQTNALSMTVSPVHTIRASSLLAADYSALLRFDAAEPLTCASPTLDFPLDTSREISVTHVTVDGSVELSLRASRLGRDLLLSVLMSPGGLVGVLQCGDQLVWLRGRATDSSFAYAAVWRRRTGDRTQLYVKSESEYPIDVHRLAIRSGALETVYSGTTRLGPWQSLVVRLPDNWSSSQPIALVAQASPIATSPITFKQYRTEAP